jgi:hypothetical protein
MQAASSGPVSTQVLGPPNILPLTSVSVTVPLPSTQPGNIWLAATNLVVGDDGRLQQSAQSPEINRYISKTVRLANLKVIFVDAFPDLQKQNDWLSQSLVTVLKDQAKTDRVACEVNLRVQQDHQYMSALISMVRFWYVSPR